MDNQSINLEKEFKGLAEYLGCNEDELVSEGVKLVNAAVVEARIEELENIMSHTDGMRYYNTVKNRIATLKQQLKDKK